MANERILIVDDEPPVADGLKRLLSLEGYLVDVVNSLKQTETALCRSLYDVAIIDLRMPDVDGIEVLARCRQIDPAIAVLILTAFGTVDAAVDAFKLGAKDFLKKPVRRDALLAAVAGALDNSRLAREARALRERFKTTSSFNAIVGSGDRLREALNLAAKYAPSEMSVIIFGETGTGKDLMAAAIHEASARRSKSMVTAVVAAGPEELQKSALFGHMKGAFTGADVNRRGFFQQAEGSTLFLDEIAEVSQGTQVALLRALDKKLIRPVGGEEDIPVDVRIICATHRDLNREVEEGRFREDLYYRIKRLTVQLPPLRERLEDIPLLATHFLSEYAGQQGNRFQIAPETIEALCQWPWRGNVREFKSVMEQAILLCEGDTIRPEHCFPSHASARGQVPESYFSLPLEQARSRFMADYLGRLLARYEGDTKKVAQEAEVHVTSIRRYMTQLGIAKKTGSKK